MKKLSLYILGIVTVGLLSGCVIRESEDEYKREQYQSTEIVSEILVEDISTDVIVQKTNKKELTVDYSDSPNNPWYNIDISRGVLTIEKTRGTVGVDNNSLVISLPQNEYQKFSIVTTNGNIIFNNTSSLAYKCSTQNGDIRGNVVGVESEYLIVIDVKNGSSNIKNNVIESSKTIEFNVVNGNINFEIEQP